jgi:predicted Ser/Thr protein kinase
MPERLAPGLGEQFGAYAIESLLGRGGMGTVYLATHERLQRKVALKVIAPELAEDDDFRTRFLRESQLAASLDHPNVIPIYDADEVDGVLYLAMRYVDGPSLRDRIRGSGRLPPEQTRLLARQIGGALDAAHARGLVHRDVKPANILLARPDDHAYLCDFGLAKRTSSRGSTRTGSFLGSVDYCAPEQIQGLALDGRADVYSLGCVLYHSLAGQPPYERDSEFAVLHAHLEAPPPRVSELRDDVPAELDRVLATAMAKTPEERYASAGALAAAFGHALEGTAGLADATQAAPTVATVERHPRRGSRRVWAIGAVAFTAVAVAIAAALALASRDTNGGRSVDEVALRTFVDRIENVLRQSADGRHEIAAALESGFKCSIPPGETGQRIASVADNRQSILTQIGTLAAPTDEAADIVTLLQRSLQESIEADRHYRDGFFALPAHARCPLPRNAAFGLAGESDARATRAKTQFVASFNPLAERFGRPTWSASTF